MNKINKIKNLVTNPLLFSICYISFLAINMIIVINVLAITRLMLVFFAFWAIFVFIRMSRDIEKFKQKDMLLLSLFLMICVITTLINYKYGGLSSLIRVAFFGISIVILYYQNGVSFNDYKKMIYYISIVVSIVLTISFIISIVMYMFQYSEVIESRNGTIHLGVYENRLTGIFSSSNVGGMFAIISIFLAELRLMITNKKKLSLIFFSIQYIISLWYISLSLSRGTYVSLITLVIFQFIFIKTAEDKLVKNICKKILCFGVLVLISLFVLLLTREISLVGMNYYVKSIVSNQKTITSKEDEDNNIQSDNDVEVNIENNNGELNEKEGIEIVHEEANVKVSEKESAEEIYKNAQLGFAGRVESQNKNIDFTNKRKDIWKAHLSLIKGKNFFTGVNNPVIYYEKNNNILSQYQIKWINWAKGNMHNGYIQILVNCGIIAFVLFLLFILKSSVESLVFLLKERDEKKYNMFVVALSFVIAILVNNVFETNMVLMGANFIQALFWFICGLSKSILSENQSIDSDKTLTENLTKDNN